MASFKVYNAKDSKSVLCKGNFNEIEQFEDLKKMIEKSLKTSSSQRFKLMFIDGTFIPEEVSEGIWDNETFKYFKNKLLSHGINDGKYRLYIEQVNSLPVWKKKNNKELLDENLKKYWNLALNDIMEELNLIKLEESKNNFDKLKEEYKKNEENLKSVQHTNIICSNCFKKDFSGKRFICSECDNYNLCMDCEKICHEREIHQKEHIFIQITKNLNDDILKYNNIIGSYCKEFKNVENSFKLEFTVVNNGENDLQNCFILPVRFGDDYLCCDAYIIKDSVKRGMNTKINLDVKLPKNIGYFEGYFRMFTPSGLPFGNVISIKVLNGN